MLTAKGRSEAAGVAEHSANVRITAIYTSDLERARETAEIIGQALRLPSRERSRPARAELRHAEGRPLSELSLRASGIEVDRVVDADVRPPEGESLRELYRRVARLHRRRGARDDRRATSSW